MSSPPPGPLVAPAGLVAWLAMLDSLGEPAWIVEADTLVVAGLNPPARSLLGLNDVVPRKLNASSLIGTPEDLAFWDEVGAGRAGRLESEAIVVATDGRLLQVMRRIAPLQVRGCATDALPGDGARPQRAGTPATRARGAAHRVAGDAGVHRRRHPGDGPGRPHSRLQPPLCELWDMPPDLLNGAQDDAVFDWMRRSVSDPRAYQRQLAALQESTLTRAADTLQLLSGQTFEMVTQPQVCRGRPIGRVWAFRDRTELVNADRRIEALITTDALTGLPNRRCLGDTLELSLAHAQRDRAGFALLLLDLDRFKQINDSLGNRGGRPRADRGGRARQDLPAAGRPAGAGGR